MDSHRKHGKHKKEKKKKKRRRSSSSSDSSVEDEWVEASPGGNQAPSFSGEGKSTKNKPDNDDNDHWKTFANQFHTREQIQEKRKPKDERPNILDKPGQSERELNPYWKDGGSGLPKEYRELSVTGSEFGDYGLDWMRRSLRRAKEQASEEKRPLEEIVAERWGSLSKLQSMIKEAEEKVGVDYSKQYSQKQDFSRKSNYQKYNCDFSRNSKDKLSSKQRFMKPKDGHSSDDEHDRMRDSRKERDVQKGKRNFAKPYDNDDDADDASRRRSRKNMIGHSSGISSSSKRGWRKPGSDGGEGIERKQTSEKSPTNVVSSGSINEKDGAGNSKVVSSPPEVATVCYELTADERNELAAKLIKAELLGNVELANELKNRLDQARSAAAAPEKVVLTRTDAKGFTQPLPAPTEVASSHGRKREKVKTHEGGKRVRYFADDDRFTLQDMFEREKRNTVEDQNEVFARLAGKNIGRDDSARDMEDVFEEVASVKESDERNAARDRSRAISQYKRSNKALENCQWCLDSKVLLKHMLVSIGTKVYLCLPPYESLTEGHCLLVTNQHVTCCVQADEEVWEEIQTFRKALVDLFLSMDMDVIFFEYAAGFSRFPHTVLQCVPLPKEQGDLAPIYFKKAILECETEWSTNKKLIDLSGKNVRRAVPKGLPYFFVDFGLQPGYAHVIEDEQMFSRNFAQEIIGGILDIDHNKWRKPRREKFEDQRKKVVEFTKLWKPFDFTKKIDN